MLSRYQVALADGRGGNPTDRFTPQAATDLLRYWLDQPQAKTFRMMLPELGVNGSLADDVCRDCPAKGKVFAKTGTVALPDPVNERLIQAESLGGYLEVEPGRFYVFYLVVNGATAQDIDDVVQISKIWPTSLLACKKTPRSREMPRKAANSECLQRFS